MAAGRAGTLSGEETVHRFEATIEGSGVGGAFVRISFDAKESLGSGRPGVPSR